MMIQLAYVSSTRGLLTLEDIKDILIKSRKKNAQKEITGMLLYKDGNVLQILEGNQKEVEAIFDVIRHDLRHKDVMVLYRKEITHRDFPEWNMGFSDLDADGAKNLDGFTEFLDRDFDIHQIKPSAAAKLLKTFKTNIR